MKISKQKEERIYEQILSFLYSNHPIPLFTSHIAKELARDEEFIKKLLISLKNKKLVSELKKNKKGEVYVKRSRWVLSDKAYSAYKKL